MTKPSPLSVEEVLGKLLDEFETPSPRAIAEFSRRHPEHRAALRDFAAAWAEEDCLPEATPLSAEQEARVASHGHSYLQNLLYERAASVASLDEAPVAPPTPAPVRTLAQLASDCGLSPHEAARSVGLDIQIMGELNRRGILPQSIPKWLARAFADLFSVSVDRIIASWTLPPAQAPAMGFMARAALPGLGQRSFAEAVLESTQLSDAEKAELLRER